MIDAITANRFGAVALAATDASVEAIASVSGHGTSGAAALTVIYEHGRIDIGRLALALDLTHSGAVRLVDRLSTDGLVRRHPGTDKRHVLVKLTRRGEARRRAMMRERAAVLRDMLGVLTKEERARLARFLDRILHHLVECDARWDKLCRLCDFDDCVRRDCPVSSHKSDNSKPTATRA